MCFVYDFGIRMDIQKTKLQHLDSPFRAEYRISGEYLGNWTTFAKNSRTVHIN